MGHEQLIVWQKAIRLVGECYRLSALFPSSERYALTQQLRGAAVSVAANIAEGHGRRYTGDYLHHLSHARGSLKEVETYFAVAVEVGFATAEQVMPAQRLADEISRMLTALRRYLMRVGGRTPEIRSKV